MYALKTYSLACHTSYVYCWYTNYVHVAGLLSVELHSVTTKFYLLIIDKC